MTWRGWITEVRGVVAATLSDVQYDDGRTRKNIVQARI